MCILKEFKYKNYTMLNNFDLFLKNDLLYLKGNFGIINYKMPTYYLYNINNNKIIILFLNKFIYISFLKHFFVLYNNLYNIFLIRLKVKGLGYRIRKITNKLYYFFFNYTNMFYFHKPNNLVLKWYKKKLLLICNNNFFLKLIFSNILLLKKLGTYKLRGIRLPRQIILIKKGGKKI